MKLMPAVKISHTEFRENPTNGLVGDTRSQTEDWTVNGCDLHKDACT
jgi:hypothetical protein